jgi:hypothetical protein
MKLHSAGAGTIAALLLAAGPAMAVPIPGDAGSGYPFILIFDESGDGESRHAQVSAPSPDPLWAPLSQADDPNGVVSDELVFRRTQWRSTL